MAAAVELKLDRSFFLDARASMAEVPAVFIAGVRT
jgi:hypothetical protein